MTPVLLTDESGSVAVADGALAQIVAQAVESVAGARLRKGRRRLALELDNGRLRAELELTVAYGSVLPDVARKVQERVAEALREMCGVVVDAVDVSIEELGS